MRKTRGDGRRVALLGVYAFACVLLLSMSGVFYMLQREGQAREVLGRLDKAALFILIARTHTPVQAIFFGGVAR